MTRPDDRLRAALSGRYAIERELGRGGMATVHLARDLKHDRPVAVKVLHDEVASVLGAERFLREIRVTARLNHPHILPLLDSGEAQGMLYYVMPYVEGESLRDRLRREGQLPVEVAVGFAREVADALEYAHAHGVVHRDIKPENVLVESGHAVVVDFGIARAIHAAGGDTLTASGVTLGTPAYMSPEQATGSREIDGRSDIYSLGCVLFEMLAGRAPFVGPTVASITHQHLTALPPRIGDVRPTTPDSIGTTLQRALAKEPADRFERSAQFAAALSGAIPTSPMPRRGPRGGRLVATLVATAALLVAGVATVRAIAGRAERFPRSAVAVLPFDNLSADPGDTYFASGLHDEILTHLAKLSALQVTSRTSVTGFVRPNLPPIPEIGRQLRVGTIIEGSVQVRNGRLRVIAQLIDANTDSHLWGETYDRSLDDAFAIQSEIAQAIVAAVGASLTADEARGLATLPTKVPQAYRHFLQGKDYLARPGFQRIHNDIAQQQFEQAIALDSTFALAHAALSEMHGAMYFTGVDPSRQRRDLQEAAARTAIRLAPELPEARRALGTLYYYGYRDFERALTEFRAVRPRLPNDEATWARIGQVTRRLGLVEESVKAHERTTELSPRSAEYFKELGVTYNWARRYREAVAAYTTGDELAPEVRQSRLFRAETFVRWTGVVDTLARLLSEPGWNAPQYVMLLGLYQRDPVRLTALADSFARRGSLSIQTEYTPVGLLRAWAHQLRGEPAAAITWLRTALPVVDSALAVAPADPRLHVTRGLILAGLSRRADALAEAEWIRNSANYREDRFSGPEFAAGRAMILAHAGAADDALDQIESLLTAPGQLTVHLLALDPRWDSIRDHPRFRELLRKYAVR